MNLIFTCGGTAGHINPAIAVANEMKNRYPDANILFIGAVGKMEEQLVPKAGFQLKALPASGLSRKLNPKGIKQNIYAVKCVLNALSECKKLFREFKPDAVIGTGGYASFPALLAANMLGVPICVHEANAMPGLTTRMIANRANRVLTCFPESAKYYRHPEKVEVVGMPVKKEFIFTKKAEARKELGLDERPLIVSAFGSQGARAMNKVTAELFKLEKEADYPFQHIHAIGRYGVDWMPDAVKEQGVDLTENRGITMLEYIYNMPTLMAAADVVISRAGASSCNEIAASGTPCILIPSPNVTDNHQEKNARALADQGAAVLVREEECTAQRLMEEIQNLLQSPERYSQMERALLRMCVPDSAERLCRIAREIAKEK